MLQIQLFPALSNCIETVAKREYRVTLGQLLAGDEENKELQERIELLRVFLETADFRRLRTESEKHLLEGRKVKFVVHLEEENAKYEMEITQ
ncbi:hypothetical protein ACFLX9_01660 [Chloroflexota bacterium]